MILIIGIGIDTLLFDTYSYSSLLFDLAKHFKQASDTPKMALAPSLLLFSVPSNSIKKLSTLSWSAFLPNNAGLIILFTLSTAFKTPFPSYRFGSLSRSSKASLEPVDAPLGTDAVALIPLSSVISTSIVGFPLLSSISLA